MAIRASRFGLYLAIASTIWLAWIAVFLPTLSVSSLKACAELRALAQTHEKAFMDQCMQTMDRGPEKASVLMLVVTCLVLIVVSAVMWLRERKLVRRLEQPSA